MKILSWHKNHISIKSRAIIIKYKVNELQKFCLHPNIDLTLLFV